MAGRLPTVLSCFLRPSLDLDLQRGLHRYKPDSIPASLRERAIHLPDKVFCYFNTVIVTADVHWCLAHSAATRLRRGTTQNILAKRRATQNNAENFRVVLRIVLCSSARQVAQRLASLTFQHWSGVTPYTSSCELAGSCVFVKQSLGVFSCSPA